MNEQVGTVTAPIFNGAPAWLTLPFALIALGVAFALFILFHGARLARRRREARDEVRDYNAEYAEDRPAAVPPVTPPPPPQVPAAPVVAAEPAPEAPAAPEPLADEPIAAAGAFDASPASLAADLAEPSDEAAADDLTRMKGVGPRLAERLNAAGVTRFAQLAALTPEDAAALDARLEGFQGRIHKDRWIEQAGFLARGDTAGYEAVFGKL